jgi:hypothetical protein
MAPEAKESSGVNTSCVGGINDTRNSRFVYTNNCGFPTRGFPAQSLPRSRTHLHVRVKCPLLLFDINKDVNLSTYFSKSSQCEIS